MNPIASASLYATMPFALLAGQDLPEHPKPVVIVQQAEMPQFVLESYISSPSETTQTPSEAVPLYHSIRRSFSISQTEMSKWLGVKRRTLYNWLKSPESATRFGPIIEKRLSSLNTLRNEMEPEHRSLIFKIAFSPIYGEPRFGNAILEGSSGEELVNEYDKLFSKFEAYRKVASRQERMG